MDDDLPRYLEAYPELDAEMVGRGRGGREGIRRVTWFTEHGAIAGKGELEWLDGPEFLISCDVEARGYAQPTLKARRIRYDFLPRGAKGYRTCALCPVCTKKSPKLYLKDHDWACAVCRGLRNRSTFISPQRRWSEEIDLLNLETKEGRPPGMREKAYREKLARLVYLKDKRKGGRKLPDARFMHATHAVWDERSKTSKVERG